MWPTPVGHPHPRGLAALLLGEPPVLILDEPGNGLDPQGIRTLRDLLRAHAAKGGTVFVSSHMLSDVEHLADDVVVINDGRLVTHGALANDTASWMLNVLAGVGDDVSQPAAIAAILAWAAVPAIIGLFAVQRRDVV